MKTKANTTLERWSTNSRFKKALRKQRDELFLSELVTALMVQDGKTGTHQQVSETNC